MENISYLSKHGEKNSQRRSFRYSDRELFDLYADEIYVGKGCYRLYFTCSILDGLISDGLISRQQADRVSKKYKIQEGRVDVTVANTCGKNKKNFKKWRNGKSCLVFKGKKLMGFF